MSDARKLTIDPLLIQIVHIWNRCVRRAFLCGYDSLTGRDFDHRRQWIRDRMEFLASIFAIEVISFSILSNHYHQVLRSRPDVVDSWSDEEVARRSMLLEGKTWFREDGSDRKSTQAEINRRTNDAKKMKELRHKLSNISKWMQNLDQHISVKANREDNVKGTFWEKRFGSEVLTQSADILACMIYVDLNPIRAQMATTPEESDFTGAQERINDLRIQFVNKDDGISLQASHSGAEVHQWERLNDGQSGWMPPIEINETSDPIGPDADSQGRRASRKGVLPLSLLRYLELLDWSGRVVRNDKRGAIPMGLTSILDRIGASVEGLLEMASKFALAQDPYFKATEREGVLAMKPT